MDTKKQEEKTIKLGKRDKPEPEIETEIDEIIKIYIKK